jgi:agmatinase
VDENRLNLPFGGFVTFIRSPLCTDLRALDADIAVIGFPYDEGLGWIPGQRFGPRALREISMVLGGTSGASEGKHGYWDIDTGNRVLDYELAQGRIVDCGDIDVIYTRPDDSWDNATRDVSTILEAGALPVVLGGCHGITFPIVRAFRDDLYVVHFDAHIDYQPFVHGVIHAAGNPMRMVATLPNVKKIVQVGIRAFRTHEGDVSDSRADGNVILPTAEIRRAGPQVMLDQVPAGAQVYASIDIDVLDMPLVPGTSAAEPDGFAYRELRDLLVALATHAEIIGFDLVEVNPMIDLPSKATAFLGAQLIVEFLGRCVQHPQYLRRHPRKAE